MRQLHGPGMGISEQRAVHAFAQPGRVGGIGELGGDAGLRIGLRLEAGEIAGRIGNAEAIEEGLAEGGELKRGKGRGVFRPGGAQGQGRCAQPAWVIRP